MQVLFKNKCWFLSLRIFILLSSSLLFYFHPFGWYIFWPSSGVSCWTQNFELLALLLFLLLFNFVIHLLIIIDFVSFVVFVKFVVPLWLLFLKSIFGKTLMYYVAVQHINHYTTGTSLYIYIYIYCHVIAHGDDRGKINTILPLN